MQKHKASKALGRQAQAKKLGLLLPIIMDWITCPSCDEEFKIITENTALPEYCPYCSAELELENLYEADPYLVIERAQA